MSSNKILEKYGMIDYWTLVESRGSRHHITNTTPWKPDSYMVWGD